MNKKFMNSKNNLIEDMIEGFVKANENTLSKLENSHVILSKKIKKGKVGVVIGNGSGHEPACIGFVGENMLDANAYGGLFAAPGPQAIVDAIEAADQGNGVCLLVSNHAGDVINSKMAESIAKSKGINVRSVILFDDIASASKEEDPFERRGAAGTLFVYKLVGSYSTQNVSLDEVCDYAEYVRDNVRTLSVSSVSGSNPITNEMFFSMDEDKYEIGMGVHGETMENRIDVISSQKLSRIMIDMLVKDKPFDRSIPISILVNGMGRTTWMELHIFYNDVSLHLQEMGFSLVKPIIGNYITTQDTAGISLSLCAMNKFDEQMLLLPTNAVAFRGL